MSNRCTYTMSWQQLEKFVKRIVKYAKDLKFTKVLGIGRGGLIPAVMVSYKLDLPLAVTMCSLYTGKTKSTFNCSLRPKGISENDNVLVVDSISHTGTTLKEVKKMLEDKRVNHKVATLFYRAESKTKPDYYCRMTDKWVEFVWES